MTSRNSISIGKIVGIVVSAALIMALMAIVYVVSSALDMEPKQHAVVEVASEFLGYDLGDSWQIKDWVFESKPDFILDCTIVLPEETYQELIEHCEKEGFQIEDRSDDSKREVGEVYYKSDYRPEDMETLSVRVSTDKPEIYFHHWMN